MGLSIDITIEHAAWSGLSGLEARVEAAADAAVRESGQAVAPGTELSVVFCDDAFIKVLNRDYRTKDKATNVLSFPADAIARAVTLGDVILAYETCEREAEAEGKAFADHVTHLVIHGVLHLLGHDHETDAEADVMEQAEIRALARLGIPSPYEDATPLRAEP